MTTSRESPHLSDGMICPVVELAANLAAWLAAQSSADRGCCTLPVRCLLIAPSILSRHSQLEYIWEQESLLIRMVAEAVLTEQLISAKRFQPRAPSSWVVEFSTWGPEFLKLFHPLKTTLLIFFLSLNLVHSPGLLRKLCTSSFKRDTNWHFALIDLSSGSNHLLPMGSLLTHPGPPGTPVP